VNPLGVVARSLGGVSWFSRVAKWIVPVDTAVQRRTRGRVALTTVVGINALLLTTVGRRSGEPRTVSLLYVDGPEGYVVAGSNWGGPHHPAWSANLLADPTATVTVAGRTERVTSHLAEGAERAELWALLTARWPAYDAYADRSGRDIRVFVLTVDS
jgi:deazaflavin-dependent oxidoreductase (nitroreductase family)